MDLDAKGILEKCLRECPADVSRIDSSFVDNVQLRQCIEEIHQQVAFDPEGATACQKLVYFLVTQKIY